jgi:hypothetical protein
MAERSDLKPAQTSSESSCLFTASITREALTPEAPVWDSLSQSVP